MKRLIARVSGRVQMVMYRDFAQRKARGLRLVGEVRNIPDGTVRVVAEGPYKKLQEYVEKLKRGPLLARVDHVEVSYEEPTASFSTFSIRYD